MTSETKQEVKILVCRLLVTLFCLHLHFLFLHVKPLQRNDTYVQPEHVKSLFCSEKKQFESEHLKQQFSDLRHLELQSINRYRSDVLIEVVSHPDLMEEMMTSSINTTES